MSRQFSAIVLCPNGRRETIKLSSNSSILQILEEACVKQKLNPGDFDLWHYKKSLDLSLPIRFANLPNNALLELHPAKNPRKECMVTIALQLESGERIMKDFTPSSTLSDVLQQCIQTNSMNFDTEGEQVCIYMRQQISGEEIKTTTLRSLGLTQGTAIIRLLHRKPESLGSQAHISSPLTSSSYRISDSNVNNARNEADYKRLEPNFNIEDPVGSSMDVDSMENIAPVAALTSNNENASKNCGSGGQMDSMECDSEDVNLETFSDQAVERNINYTEATTGQTPVDYSSQVVDSNSDGNEEFLGVGSINYIGERHAVVYSLDDITDVKKADLPEEFFELTIDDVKYLMNDYKKERLKWVNQPLQTREQRERQILQKYTRYSQTVIRIYFPERLVIQAVFKVTETVQAICDFLKNYLQNKDLDFYLYTTPPKEKLNPSENLIESMLVPAAVVYFGSATQLPQYLASTLRSMKSDPRAAALAATESIKKNCQDSDDTVCEDISAPVKLPDSSETPSTSISDHNPHDSSLPKSAKIPKWMKLSKQ